VPRRLLAALSVSLAALLLSVAACGGLDVEPVDQGEGVSGEWSIAAPTVASTVVTTDCTGNALGEPQGTAYETFARSCRADAVDVTQTGDSLDIQESVAFCTPVPATSPVLARFSGSGSVSGDRVTGSGVFTTHDDVSERIDFEGTVSGDSVTLTETRRYDLPNPEGSPSPEGSCAWSGAVEYDVTITR
jgi:hypothetical protein